MKRTKLLYLMSCCLLLVGLASCSDSKDDVELQFNASIQGNKSKTLYLGRTLELAAKVENAIEPTYEWLVNGKDASHEATLEFTPTETGDYEIQLTVKSEDKEITDVVKVAVVEYTEDLIPVKTIDDIQFWVGKGDSRSVLGVQWVDGGVADEPTQDDVHFLAWGFHHNSDAEATGENMLLAIAKADPRLFVVLGPGLNENGFSVFGFGYDGNDDGEFSICNKEKGIKYTSVDFSDGVLILDNEDIIDGFSTTNDADYWQGGWKKRYNTYYLSGNETENALSAEFTYSQIGITIRMLANNSWDAWTLSSINEESINIEPISEWMVAAPISK